VSARPTLAATALLAALYCSIAPPAAAESEAASLRERSMRATAIEHKYTTERAAWQNEYRRLLSGYVAARDRASVSRNAWRSLRKRNRLRGETRIEARKAIEDSRAALASAIEAVHRFQGRAQVDQPPPGWRYQVEDEFPGIAQEIASL